MLDGCEMSEKKSFTGCRVPTTVWLIAWNNSLTGKTNLK